MAERVAVDFQRRIRRWMSKGVIREMSVVQWLKRDKKRWFGSSKDHVNKRKYLIVYECYH